MIEKIIEKAKKDNKKVYVFAHRFPDGDAICSSQAVVEYLKDNGIEAKYVVSNIVNRFSKVVGDIEPTESVEEGNISLIMDTSTVRYAENDLFKKSLPEDTYVIDHHRKANDARYIEDELNLPSENVIRDSDASSTCEIMVGKFKPEMISSKIANYLTLGLLTDTARLRHIKSNTLRNLSKLIVLGADYNEIMGFCNNKIALKREVGMSKALLKTKTFPIGDSFGMILSLDNEEVQKLQSEFGIYDPQKKIFLMDDIENCSLTCLLAENTPGEYNTEFRSTPLLGNFDVQKIATMHGGGGHYHASGCPIDKEKFSSKEEIEKMFIREFDELYSNQANNLSKQKLTERDTALLRIFNKTNRLRVGVSPELFARVNSLMLSGANYELAFKEFKTYKEYMLKNEIMSKIPEEIYNQDLPVVSISLSDEEVKNLTNKYSATEEDILNVIYKFENVNISSAAILLPDGKQASITEEGIIEKTAKSVEDNNSEGR